MSRSMEVRVEWLALRLRGVPAPIARAAVGGVGRDLVERLSRLTVPVAPARIARPLLDAGIVRLPQPAGEAGVRDAIARAVASSIESAWHGEGRG